MKIKVGVIFGLILLGMFFSAWSVKAQTPAENGGVTIANGNPRAYVDDQKIDNVDNGKIQVSFSINSNEKNLSGVKYSLVLVKSGEEKQIVDEKVFDETFDLGPNEQKQITATYKAPEYLNGSFELLLNVRNQKNFSLADSFFNGNIGLNGSGQYAELIFGKGYLSIQDDPNKKQYEINVSTASIEKNENLVFNGEFTNYFKKDVAVYPSFTIYPALDLGKFVSTQKSDKAITLKAGAKQLLQIPVPKVEKPQIYGVKMDLVNASGESVSVPVKFNYVLKGESAIIQFASLDKDYYKKGEKAKLDLIWNHRDSSTGAEKNYSLEVAISDNNGNDCSKKTTKNIAQSENLQFPVIESLPIISNCLNPEATVQIKSASGEVLDVQIIKMISKNVPNKNPATINQSANAERLSSSMLIKILGAFAIFLAIILALIIFKRKKGSSMMAMFFALVLGYALFFSAGTAMACPSGYCNAEGWGGEVGIDPNDGSHIDMVYYPRVNVRPYGAGSNENIYTQYDTINLNTVVDYINYYGDFNIKYKIVRENGTNYVDDTEIYDAIGLVACNETYVRATKEKQLTEAGNFTVVFTIDPSPDENIFDGDHPNQVLSLPIEVVASTEDEYTMSVNMYDYFKAIGTGKITSDPSGIDCVKYGPSPLDFSGNCTKTFPAGTIVTLKGKADPDSKIIVFSSYKNHKYSFWDENVPQDEYYERSYLMNGNWEVSVKFYLKVTYQDLSVTANGNGKVTVAYDTILSDVINEQIIYKFPWDAMVNLKATANSGSVFQGWTGDALGNSQENWVWIGDYPKSVTAEFCSYDYSYDCPSGHSGDADKICKKTCPIGGTIFLVEQVCIDEMNKGGTLKLTGDSFCSEDEDDDADENDDDDESSGVGGNNGLLPGFKEVNP